jgi:hypothetical protein
MMKTEEFLSGLALVISVVALGMSVWQAWRGEAISMRPLLVFAYEPDSGWSVRNVGNGPAMNVLVAEKGPSGPWRNPMRLPAISAGGVREINWLDNPNVRSLGATYSDFANRKYTLNVSTISLRRAPAIISALGPRNKSASTGKPRRPVRNAVQLTFAAAVARCPFSVSATIYAAEA